MQWQVIPTKVHGAEDYMTVGTLPMLTRMAGLSPKARRILDVVTGTMALQSLTTDYELGARRLMPMTGHLALDVAMGAGLIGVGSLMSGLTRADRAMFVGLGAFALAMAALTKRRPADEPFTSSSANLEESLNPA